MRAIWRLPLILMVIRSCRGEKATHEQLHVLSWALRTSDGPETLSRFLAGQLRPEEAVVRFEPALDRGVAWAEAFELLGRQGRYWSITGKGEVLLAAIDGEPEVLSSERSVLSGLKGKLTQSAVERMLRRA